MSRGNDDPHALLDRLEDEARTRVSAATRRIEDEAGAAGHALSPRHVVREHPIATTATAAGGGFLLARLAGARRDGKRREVEVVRKDRSGAPLITMLRLVDVAWHLVKRFGAAEPQAESDTEPSENT